jgi:hypothetical protein
MHWAISRWMDQEILRPAAISSGWRKLAVLRHRFNLHAEGAVNLYTWIPWHGYQSEENLVAAQAPVHIRWKVFLPFCRLSLSASSEIDVGCTCKQHLIWVSLKEAPPPPPHVCAAFHVDIAGCMPKKTLSQGGGTEQVLTLLACIWQVSGSNLRLGTGFTTVLWFSSVCLSEHCGST